MEDRIIDLEKKVSFQEHAVEELTEVSSTQEKRIRELEVKLETLVEKLKNEEYIRKPEEEEPPPHY